MGMLSKRSRIFLCLLSGLIGFMIGYNIKVHLEASQFVVASWEQEPIVVVCPDSSLSAYRVNRAIEWWGIRGYKINGYHFDDDDKICSLNRFVDGIIFIRAADQKIDPEFYAVTSRNSSLEKMIAATITLPNRNRHLNRLLEHELGHALGLGHVDIDGHIMHPILSRTGERFWIPD